MSTPDHCPRCGRQFRRHECVEVRAGQAFCQLGCADGEPRTPRERAEQLTLGAMLTVLRASRASMRLEKFGRGNGHKATLLVRGEVYARATGPTAEEALYWLIVKAFEASDDARLTDIDHGVPA